MPLACASGPRTGLDGSSPPPRGPAVSVLLEIERSAASVVVVGHSEENRQNLDESYYLETIEPLVGTRLYRQEVAAEILVDVEGSLFPRQLIDKNRVKEHPELRRIVVGVDPSGTATGDRTGIVICGKGEDGHGYVLADWSLRASPDEWARRVVQAYRSFGVDDVVVETNFGADLALSVLRQADPDVRVKKVTATRGKVVRAAPVALKYERGEVHHLAGAGLEQLEDELVLFTDDGQPIDPSPDRADACIWALTDLLERRYAGFGVIGYGEAATTEICLRGIYLERLAATGTCRRRKGVASGPLPLGPTFLRTPCAVGQIPGRNSHKPDRVTHDRASLLWWAQKDSNLRPPACKAGALHR